jgi:hypothetical protein
MAEAQRIPWKRLSIEAAAIVVSILLAFAIDAWWDQRQERSLERTALIGLQSEYQNHRALIVRDKAQHESIIQHVFYLMDATQSGTWKSNEFSIDKSIHFLLIPSTTDFGNGVRNSLINAGHIGIISDVQLRYDLSAWDSVREELIDDQELNRNLVMNIVTPYLTRLGVPHIGWQTYTEENWGSIESWSLASDPDSVARLLNDPEFQSILTVRFSHLHHANREFDRTLGAIDSILAKIEVSLDTL